MLQRLRSDVEFFSIIAKALDELTGLRSADPVLLGDVADFIILLVSNATAIRSTDFALVVGH